MKWWSSVSKPVPNETYMVVDLVLVLSKVLQDRLGSEAATEDVQ